MEKQKLTVEQIDFEVDRLEQKISDKDKQWDHNKPFDEYWDYIAPEQGQIAHLDRTKRMIMPFELSELPDYGDVMSLEHFIENVKHGLFIDYDGYGHYVKDGMESDISIHPSDVEYGAIRSDFDTIIWYNR